VQDTDRAGAGTGVLPKSEVDRVFIASQLIGADYTGSEPFSLVLSAMLIVSSQIMSRL
jgi:hypothetical protein